MKAIVSMSYMGNELRVPTSLQHELVRQGYNTIVFTYVGIDHRDAVTNEQFMNEIRSADVFFGIVAFDTNASNRVIQDFMNIYKLPNCKAAVLLVDSNIILTNTDDIKRHIISFDSRTGEIHDVAKLKKVIDSVRSNNTGARILFGAAALTLLGIVVSGSLSSTGSEPTRTSNASTGVAVSNRKSAKKPSAKKPSAKKPSAKKPAKMTAAKRSPKR